ncbi:MAG: sugar transferase [Microbacterium sp.]|uniref:sugar transferase n=1 Tax=Microbacterium sp. TaxID=51671 RepID=UPI002720B845|nr:sugar transferase [Microbacterium sp.]MDO8383763.1 sugar transferase [Microbacterium sp.]
MTAIDDVRVFAPPIHIAPAKVGHPTNGRTVANAAPRIQPGLEQRRLWERRYLRRLRVTDTVIVLATVASTAFGAVAFSGLTDAHLPNVIRVPALTALTWLVVLAIMNTRDARIMGAGPSEYKRVAHATGLAFGLLAIAFVIFQWQGVRFQLIFAMPIGLVALLIGRWSWRKWLLAKRRLGHYASRAIVIGSRKEVRYVLKRLEKDGQLGYIVVGTAIDDGRPDGVVVGRRTYGVVSNVGSVASVAREINADTIIVASTPRNDPGFIKRLSWQLEGTAAELILSSRLADVAGPRISLRPVEGLPLIHVRIPTFEGGPHLVKRAFDIAVSLIALLSISALAPLIALAIKIDSRGPVFFRQLRVGRDGREFRMVKFRSMKTTAEQELAALLDANEGSGPLFKMKADPRVTRVGRILRKFSLDELPQFWNVLVGDMSIVGPRPPLPSEVTAYDGHVFRRLYIKPGITGLWQVSGRSDLSWEESVKLDLRYVENWSLTQDLIIMWRTVKVMLQPSGAY